MLSVSLTLLISQYTSHPKSAMDEELEERTELSRLHTDFVYEGNTEENRTHPNELDLLDNSVAEDMHVLSNLMQSLEVSAGGSGPVQNMMKEMSGIVRKGSE
jgi:hypothetical protein